MRVERHSKDSLLFFPTDDPNYAVELTQDDAIQFLEDLNQAVDGDDSIEMGYASVRCRAGGSVDLCLGGHTRQDDLELTDDGGQTVQLCDVDGVTRDQMVACAVGLANYAEGDMLFGDAQPDEDGEVGTWRRVTWGAANGGGIVIMASGHDEGEDEDFALDPYVLDGWEQGQFARAISRVTG